MKKAHLGLVILVAVVMTSALGVVYARHESRKLFVELRRLQAIRDDMNIEWGRLQLEEGTWTAHGRLEGIAGTRLEMRMPRPEDVVIVRP